MNRKYMLALAAVLCAAGMCFADGQFRLYNIVPFSPGKEKQLAEECREYVARTGNRTVLYSMTLHPEAKPAMKKVSVPSGRLARKAPSIIVPSMMA